MDGDAAIAWQISVRYKRGAMSITVGHHRSIRHPPCSLRPRLAHFERLYVTLPQEMSKVECRSSHDWDDTPRAGTEASCVRPKGNYMPGDPGPELNIPSGIRKGRWEDHDGLKKIAPRAARRRNL